MEIGLWKFSPQLLWRISVLEDINRSRRRGSLYIVELLLNPVAGVHCSCRVVVKSVAPQKYHNLI